MKQPILRGAIGGAAGGLIWLMMVSGFQAAAEGIGILSLIIIGYLLLVLPTTIVIGAVTGLLIKLINIKSNKNIGVIFRSIVGIVVAIGAMALYLYKQGDISSDNVSWMTLTYILTFGIIVGTLTGVIIGDQRKIELK
jgi:hypothetical protein